MQIATPPPGDRMGGVSFSCPVEIWPDETGALHGRHRPRKTKPAGGGGSGGFRNHVPAKGGGYCRNHSQIVGGGVQSGRWVDAASARLNDHKIGRSNRFVQCNINNAAMQNNDGSSATSACLPNRKPEGAVGRLRVAPVVGGSLRPYFDSRRDWMLIAISRNAALSSVPLDAA